MIHLKKRFCPYDICFFIGMFFSLFFLIWKCRFGYGANDEPLYLTFAQRLAHGDALLSEEWNLAQLSGVLLLPFYLIYDFFSASTEGIILNFRYIYVLVQTLVCLGLYVKLRRFHFAGAAAVLLFYLYTPYDVMALSYNTIGLMCMTLCLVFIACNDSHKRSAYFMAGLFYAMAVLCNPYFISIYILYISGYAAFCLFCKVTKKAHAPSPRWWSILFFTLGAAIIAGLLLLFTLSRAGFTDILNNLSEILSDPDHASRPFHWIVIEYARAIYQEFGNYLIAWLALLFLAFLDRKRKQNAWMYFGMTALVSAISVLMQAPNIQTNYNYIMFPLSLCGLTAYLLSSSKKHKTFFWLWITGILYTFCLGWASNQGLNAICMGMPLVMIASILLIGDFVSETRTNAQKYSAWLTIGICIMMFVSQLGMECYSKSVHAFWEPSVAELTTTITSGPLKGVRTTKEHAADYENLLNDIDAYTEADGPVLFITSTPWCYLYADAEYGTYSPWLSSLSTADPEASAKRLSTRLGRYYELHPDKLPSQIYIAKNDLWVPIDISENMAYAPFSVSPSFSSHIDAYSVTESEFGYHLTLIQ